MIFVAAVKSWTVTELASLARAVGVPMAIVAAAGGAMVGAGILYVNTEMRTVYTEIKALSLEIKAVSLEIKASRHDIINKISMMIQRPEVCTTKRKPRGVPRQCSFKIYRIDSHHEWISLICG